MPETQRASPCKDQLKIRSNWMLQELMVVPNLVFSGWSFHRSSKTINILREVR